MKPDFRNVPRPGACIVEFRVFDDGEVQIVQVPAIDTGRWLQVYTDDGKVYALPPQTPRWWA